MPLFISRDGVYAENRLERFQCIAKDEGELKILEALFTFYLQGWSVC